MVTAVRQTKSDCRVRLSSVEFEWVWSSTACRKFLCGICPSQKAAKMWHIHSHTWQVHMVCCLCTRLLLLLFTHRISQCAIFNMIQRKFKKEKRRKKRKKKEWVLHSCSVWSGRCGQAPFMGSQPSKCWYNTTSSWIRIKCCTPHSSFGFSLNLGRCSLLPSPPFSPSSFTSWLAHVQQTASVSPGTVHRAPHRYGRPLLPRAAPLGADSVHIVPARGRNQWPRLLYRGSRVLVMLPWKSCRCFGEKERGGRERRNKERKKRRKKETCQK